MNTTEKTIVVERTERKFITCKDCKAVSTVDFKVVGWEPCIYAPVGFDYTRLDGEAEVTVQNTFVNACPQCGSKNIVRQQLKKKKFSEKHVCDNRCQSATSEECKCSCGGENHGIKNKVHGSLFF